MDNGYRELQAGEKKRVGDIRLDALGYWSKVDLVSSNNLVKESEVGQYRRPIAQDDELRSCKTCKHDKKQIIYPSGCTGCGDGKFKNWEPNSYASDTRPFVENRLGSPFDACTSNQEELPDSSTISKMEPVGVISSKMENTTWGGIGDPPDGAECHVALDGIEMGVYQVMCSYGGHFILSGNSEILSGYDFVFRPIQPEQTEREKVSKHMAAVMSLYSFGSLRRITQAAELLYDAGYRLKGEGDE